MIQIRSHRNRIEKEFPASIIKHLTALCLLIVQLSASIDSSCQSSDSKRLVTFSPDHPGIRYTGRIDFTNPQLPRFWQPGVYIELSFTGDQCMIILNDEMLWGVNNNYVDIVLDGKRSRIQTKGKRDTIEVNGGSSGTHSLLVCKDTEANIGWLELAGIICEAIVPSLPAPARKLEFIGNSITCGTGADQSAVACGKGKWHDQHNAYLSYGAITSRALNSQYHLSAVSGIGLMRSCCNMNIIMPQVYDKVSMRNDSISWDFSTYQPDLVTVCLGQNDGIQDSIQFTNAYLTFLKRLRFYYPSAEIVCLSSPMANKALSAFFKNILSGVVKRANAEGDDKVSYFLFSKQYHNGCDSHPDLSEHEQIADELIGFIRRRMKW